ncbi:hypothetical protein ISN45_Aa07g040020 [Arabidopsis thaliana x Arabidopsis arenosa]|uniref:Uncharacterized protein n=1 Tax=Arabidopsis thaliana x Arabidopsis arenosa TaxID=1240361 RepID=A0A8T1YE16_9BRAS|nr:hypothetical protein ISN45_Aa07g040020 [Arabidopsis thaliana x Arabidopsis arenosa]
MEEAEDSSSSKMDNFETESSSNGVDYYESGGNSNHYTDGDGNRDYKAEAGLSLLRLENRESRFWCSRRSTLLPAVVFTKFTPVKDLEPKEHGYKIKECLIILDDVEQFDCCSGIYIIIEWFLTEEAAWSSSKVGYYEIVDPTDYGFVSFVKEKELLSAVYLEDLETMMFEEISAVLANNRSIESLLGKSFDMYQVEKLCISEGAFEGMCRYSTLWIWNTTLGSIPKKRCNTASSVTVSSGEESSC